jgi:UDP-N-acetylmuramoyl-tripeptide--D-alanyl-D-alanine ligase
MIRISAAEFAKVVSGKLHLMSDEMMINEIPVINSNKAVKGTFFVAFKGDHVDGHDFVDSAIKSGAKFALVSKQVNAPSIQVDDVGQALLDLTSYVRSKLTGLKLVGITGSQGKTTTKEFLASILQLVGNTVATEGNFNTDIGVPLTILRCDEQSKYCIVEMGARHVGDIAKLTKVAVPDVGVVLVVGRAHLGEFGSVEALAKTKAELITYLLPNAVAVLGSYDEFTPKMSDNLALKKIVFGDGQSVRAADVEMHGGYAHFDLVTPAGRNPVSLQLLGEHQIPNALGAAAAAHALEISNEQIATGLITTTLSSKWRMEIEELDGLKIINDYYNANPESTKAAIKTLVLLSQESGGASWAILGKMHELGEAEQSGHQEVVKYCQEIGVDHLVTVGTGLYKSGENENSEKHLLIHNCANADTVLELVSNFSAGDVILLKASRSEKFEDLANLLRTKWSGGVA